MSMIGSEAPDWTATAYLEGARVSLASKDYAGKWHILYWYPADFTWICPTEIRGFQNLLPEFLKEGIEVLGVSTDSFFSHKVWFEDRQTFPQEITHPVIADNNHAVSRVFEVLNAAAGIAYRASIIIDNQGVVRAHHVNDIQVGRSPLEILRTAQALQSGGYCSADWKTGDKFAA